MTDSSAQDERAISAELSARLASGRLFAGIDDQGRTALIETMILETFAADEVIIRQETMTQNMWLLLEGKCTVVKEPPFGEYGSSVPLADLHPPDVFGEMTLLESAPHVASVEAKTDVQTLRLRGADFQEMIQQQPRLACQIACNLIQILSERLRNVDAKLSRALDRHEDEEVGQAWKELSARIGKLYGGLVP